MLAVFQFLTLHSDICHSPSLSMRSSCLIAGREEIFIPKCHLINKRQERINTASIILKG